MIKVQTITISRPEGHSDYTSQFPKTFTTFEEANKFLQDNSHYHTDGGYDKHDVAVEWANGEDSYSYRADIASPKSCCYHSIEYNIDQRIKQGMLYYVNAYESGDRSLVSEAEYNDLKRMISDLEMSPMTKEEFDAQEVIDGVKRKVNEERQKVEELIEAFEEHKKEIISDEVVPVSNKEFTFEIGSIKARYSKEYIVIEGTQIEKDPTTMEYTDVPFRAVFKVGEDAQYGYRYYDEGRITSITQNSVMISSRSNKRIKIEDFIHFNTPDTMVSKNMQLYYR